MADPNRASDVADPALRAALERLVLLECRAQVSPQDLNASGLELSRWRSEAQRAAARATTAEAQRDRLFARLISAERVRGGLDGESGDVDLPSFIADLRSELARAERARETAERERGELLSQLRERERPPGPSDSPHAWVERLTAQGLIPSPEATLASLEQDLVSGSTAERALLEGALRDLTYGDCAMRELAAERLAALPANLCAPVFAAALSRELEPVVLAKLARGAGLTRVASLGPLLTGLRAHPDARVRAAVLVAEARLSPAPPSKAWLTDPDPPVRRRAALAAAMHCPESAEPVLSQLADDVSPSVREAVAAAAGALTPAPAALLLRLAQDDAPRVRKAALRALRAPSALADAPAAERRRALRDFLREPVVDVGEVAGEAASEPPRIVEPAAIEAELRASLRGRSVEHLAEALGATADAVRACLANAPERFIQRGPRWFLR